MGPTKAGAALTSTTVAKAGPGDEAGSRGLIGRGRALLPGLGAALAVAAIATAAGRFAPIVGAPVFAIVLGAVVSGTRPLKEGSRPGVRFAGRAVLQGAIVLLGTGLSFREVLSTGAGSLPVLAGTLAVALAGAAVIGRALKVGTDLRSLIGVGTAICGASAIAATDGVIGASSADVSYAVATIFTFNVLAVLSFPTLGHLLGLSPHAFGLFAGTAVNDMSSVVAAAGIFGHGAAGFAVIVKLTRTLAIIPITVGLALFRSARSTAHARGPTWVHVRRSVPSFIAWFLLAVGLDSAGLVPGSWHGVLASAASVMITVALAGIGLSADPREIRRAGPRPLMLGASLWVLVTVTSLVLQSTLGVLHS